jgi:ketosteroid isomerase-like protein
MKRKIMLISAILILMPLSIFSQMTDKMDKNEQAVMAVANDFFNAAVKQDANAMERLLDDDYLQVFSPRGTVVTKSELVNGYKNATPGNLETEGVDITSPKVRIYGDTAILVSGFTIRSKSADGKSVNRDFSGTMVLVKKKGQWKVASTHGSYIPPVPTATNSSNDMKNNAIVKRIKWNE